MYVHCLKFRDVHLGKNIVFIDIKLIELTNKHCGQQQSGFLFMSDWHWAMKHLHAKK